MIELVAANPEFKSQNYSHERITIQGVFVGLLRLFSGKLEKSVEPKKPIEIEENL